MLVMTILEFLSRRLSVDGLVKAIACDQRFQKTPSPTLERHRAPQRQSGNERTLLGSNGSC